MDLIGMTLFKMLKTIPLWLEMKMIMMRYKRMFYFAPLCKDLWTWKSNKEKENGDSFPFSFCTAVWNSETYSFILRR